MAIFTLRVRDSFEAAHALRSYRGLPETVHGHTWQVEAVLETDQLDAEGMGFDFVAVRGALRALVGRFDHQNVNDVAPFDRLSPTTENIARFFFEALQADLPGLVEITLFEGPACSATYRPRG
jgi:6-pyruvoyltetrahydropterin/6-carboxytetrahydropterin synthase